MPLSERMKFVAVQPFNAYTSGTRQRKSSTPCSREEKTGLRRVSRKFRRVNRAGHGKTVSRRHRYEGK
jgi:hypothetical protein